MLAENKFAKLDISRCSAGNHKGSEVRSGNSDPDQCKLLLVVLRAATGTEGKLPRSTLRIRGA